MASRKGKTELFADWKGGHLVVADQGVSTGRRFWVDSGATDAGDTSGHGNSPDLPFATLAYAFSSDRLTANNGDIVYVCPGHSETVTSAITMDIEGVKVVGIGIGSGMPTIIGGANGIDNVNITAANTTVENIRFTAATVSAADANINIANDHVTIRGVVMVMGANDRAGITVTTAGEYCVIEDGNFEVTANGPTTFIDVEAAIETPIIRNNVFIGSDATNELDTACVDFSGAAVASPIVVNNVFDGRGDATPLQAIYDYASCTGACFARNLYAGGAVSDDNVTDVTATIGAGAITTASFGAGAIDAAAIAGDAIGAAEIAAGAIDAATFAADALQAIQDEAEDALEGENLDHFVKVAVDTNLQTTVHANSALGYAMGAADMTTFDRTTDSLEALGANVAAILADTGTAGVALASDSITAAVIADGAIDAATFAAGAIDAAAIANNAIDANAIANAAITAAKIDSNAITADKLAEDCLAAAKFATGCLTADAFAANCIAAASLATDTLTAIEGEAEDALEGENLDHLVKVAVDTNLDTTVHDTSVMGYALAISDVANFDRTTDSLQAISQRGLQQSTATSTSNLTDGTIFTWTGAIEILYIIGTVTTPTADSAQTCLLQANPDALGAGNLCAAGDIRNKAAGTLLQATGTAGGAMTVTAAGFLAPASQVNSIVATSRTSGVITTVFSATGTLAGAIRWDMMWRPISPNATVA